MGWLAQTLSRPSAISSFHGALLRVLKDARGAWEFGSGCSCGLFHGYLPVVHTQYGKLVMCQVGTSTTQYIYLPSVQP